MPYDDVSTICICSDCRWVWVLILHSLRKDFLFWKSESMSLDERGRSCQVFALNVTNMWGLLSLVVLWIEHCPFEFIMILGIVRIGLGAVFRYVDFMFWISFEWWWWLARFGLPSTEAQLCLRWCVLILDLFIFMECCQLVANNFEEVYVLCLMLPTGMLIFLTSLCSYEVHGKVEKELCSTIVSIFFIVDHCYCKTVKGRIEDWVKI